MRSPDGESSRIEVSKLEAARRQLDTAIRLYFEDADTVSVHTLAGAASTLIHDLCKARGIPSMREMLLGMVRTDKRGYVADVMNAAKNFLKHADRDPEGTLSFSDDQNLYELLLGATSLFSLGTKTLLTTLFLGWFNMVHPELLKEKPGDALLHDAGDLHRLTRKEQKAEALKILTAVGADPEFVESLGVVQFSS